MKIIVVSDIHSNYLAFSEFAKVLEEYSFDKLVILGDLLTYGVEVKSTLEIAKYLDKKYDCIFIKGNHDQIYFDLQSGSDYEYKPFPNFIKESVIYNSFHLDEGFEFAFPWKENCIIGDIYFSHANTFPYGNWSYLNTEEDFDENIVRLNEIGCSIGIFGHTHRSKYKLSPESSASTKQLVPGEGPVVVSKNTKAIFTNGSLGQPRNSSSSFLICEIKPNWVEIEAISIVYKVELHKKSITDSDLSSATKEKLLSYYS